MVSVYRWNLSSRKRLILMPGSKIFEIGFGQNPFKIAGCRYQNCFTTSDRNLFPLKDLDAVLWNYDDRDHSFPTIRNPKTKYGFHNMEPPSTTKKKIEKYNGIFNFTIGHRLDFDVQKTYGMIGKRKVVDKSKLSPDTKQFLKKSRMAAWFVSHCGAESMRDRLVETMKTYIDVDIYGWCGSHYCPRSSESKCLKKIEAEYYFYLSFENSLCKDYITEKLFKILHYNIIPVVYGLGPYHLQAPPNSYIDVFDFPSVESLTNYLVYLSKNETAYNEYFRWKAYYLVLPFWSQNIFPICKICEIVNTNTSKVYEDIYGMYVNDAHCINSANPCLSEFVKGGKANMTFHEL